MKPFDFANILFSGQCNLRCPHCIGQQRSLRNMPDNLSIFPLTGIEPFIRKILRYQVTQVSLTGTNTDPQLYTYEAELLALLRERIPAVKLSLHTNGLLALRKTEVFNSYDRATISLPSFVPETCRKLTGRAHVLDLAAIVRMATIPLKISTLLTEHNIREIPAIIARCRDLGISRMTLRKLYGDSRQWPLFANREQVRTFGGNPVYDFDGMEVTLWDFSACQARCLNLFSDGSISEEYQLTKRGAFQVERNGARNPSPALPKGEGVSPLLRRGAGGEVKNCKSTPYGNIERPQGDAPDARA